MMMIQAFVKTIYARSLYMLKRMLKSCIHQNLVLSDSRNSCFVYLAPTLVGFDYPIDLPRKEEENDVPDPLNRLNSCLI